MNVTEYLKDRYGRWGWLGQRAHDADGINKVLPLDFIISCDYGTDTPRFFNSEDVFSIEKNEKVRKNWSNEHLKDSLKGSLGRRVFKRWNEYDEPVNLLCYRSINRLEKKSRSLSRGLSIYAVPESLKKYFDNKITLCRKLPRLPLKVIPCIIIQLGKSGFRQIKEEVSAPFVVQLPYGSSGNSTFLIRNEKEFKRISMRHKGKAATARKYIDGFSINVNGIIVSTVDGPQTFCSFPSVQIVGVPECSSFSTAFCGNDYATASQLDKKLLKQVENTVKSVGSWMADKGYRGIFGMDLVTDNNDLYPVEINPRFQNSTSLYTILEHIQKPGKGSLFLLHIAEFLQDSDEVMRDYVRDFPYAGLMEPVKGSQIIVHNRAVPTIVRGDLTPGIYRMKKGEMEKVSEDVSFTGIVGDDEFLVTCAVPAPFTEIEPDAPICKLQIPGPALDPASRRKLSRPVRSIVANIYEGFALKKKTTERAESAC